MSKSIATERRSLKPVDASTTDGVDSGATSVPISLRLSSQMHEALGVLSDLTNKSKSELIREFIMEGMRNRIDDDYARKMAEEAEKRWLEGGSQISEVMGLR